MEIKTCTSCNQSFPNTEENFYKRENGMLRKDCIACRKKYLKAYSAKNRAKLLEQKKQYYQDHKEEIKANSSENYYKNHEQNKEYRRQYYQENHDEIRQHQNDYRKANPDKSKAQYERKKLLHWDKKRLSDKRYREVNREKVKLKQSQYQRTERAKELHRMVNQRREAKKKDAISDFTLGQWESCLKYFNNKCAYCGSEEKLQQEHFVAIYHGGGYTKSNIVPACQFCNSSKLNHDFFTWSGWRPPLN
jgi:hypothetical protein